MFGEVGVEVLEKHVIVRVYYAGKVETLPSIRLLGCDLECNETGGRRTVTIDDPSDKADEFLEECSMEFSPSAGGDAAW